MHYFIVKKFRTKKQSYWSRCYELINQVGGRFAADTPLRALLQYGERDAADMRALSRQMAAALGPARAQTEEIAGGHDWVCWREALIPGLQRLLAHPLAKETP